MGVETEYSQKLNILLSVPCMDKIRGWQLVVNRGNKLWVRSHI